MEQMKILTPKFKKHSEVIASVKKVHTLEIRKEVMKQIGGNKS